MNHRVFALGLACLASLFSQGAFAQGLRPSGAGASGLSRTPAVTLPSTPTLSTQPRAADFIVAVVNSEPVTNNELRIRLARVQQQAAAQGSTLPPREVLLREVLERLILEKAQVQLAREGGIRVDDLAVSQAEQAVARQNNVSVAEMQRRLAADSITPERFREELRSQLLQQRLREREVDGRVRVSELDIDQYLREQQSQSGDAGRIEINLAHVLVAVPENASPGQLAERQSRAQSVANKARAGEDFATLARDYSDSPERTQGGVWGLRPLSRYPDLFVEATQTLPVGGIAGPVRSGAGFHILKVVEKSRDAGVTATAVQSHARHILLAVGPQLTEAAAAARLADYRHRVQSGQADFAALAREYSKDGSAKQGGDLGWATPGRYVPEFEQAMNALQPGGISEPVVSRFGVHLIQLLERRQVKLSVREQRDMVRDTLREKKIEEAYATWAQDLRNRAYVEFRDVPQ
ncbi:MAG: peptidylprolyl isomerase [Burkholderiaceae bacterium]|nr:peptidylprolyl isomerase [Burkholderiaceae bacterium]